MENLGGIFISWSPMLILIAVWIYFMKKGPVSKQSAYMEKVLEQQKVLNDTLLRIAESLERLEKKS